MALSNHITSSLLEPGRVRVQAQPMFALPWYCNMCSIFVKLCDSIVNIVSALCSLPQEDEGEEEAPRTLYSRSISNPVYEPGPELSESNSCDVTVSQRLSSSLSQHNGGSSSGLVR